MRRLVPFCLLLLGPIGLALGQAPHQPPLAAKADLPDESLHDDAPDFTDVVEARARLDAYHGKHYEVEPGLEPLPQGLEAARHPLESGIRIVRTVVDEDLLAARLTLPATLLPPRGHRALILDRAAAPDWFDAGPPDALTGAARRLVEERLMKEGLLAVLAELIGLIGPDVVRTHEPAAWAQLDRAGFPSDLLVHFSEDPGLAPRERPRRLLRDMAGRLADGQPLREVKRAMASIPFRFLRSTPRFRIAIETGEQAPGLVRMQAGGGYQDGIMPGGSVDVINQVVQALPESDFLVTVPRKALGPFSEMGRGAWSLSRPAQVTLVAEAAPVSTWAQDNGKAGFIGGDDGNPRRAAALTPRFASVGEAQSSYVPGESFLMEGLVQAGHDVVHSSLLFQGGNLMGVRDPRSGTRHLLVGEAEVHRNMALGLTKTQVLAAFKEEFGVDTCIVWPAASYHLDFDVSFRVAGGELVAFVNDPVAAARGVVRTGLRALARQGLLTPDLEVSMTARLDHGKEAIVAGELRGILARTRENHAALPFSLSRYFVAGPMDSAARNLQCFLVALDLLESAGATPAESEGEREAYMTSLRTLDAGRRAQLRILDRLGWKVVPIPSMPDVNHSLNYLNGIQLPDAFLMPVFGGFYAEVDEAATKAFQAVLPAGTGVIPIRAAEAQRRHGGVHCAVVVHPEE